MTRNNPPKTTWLDRRQAGVTLIEMMTALVIGTVLMAGLSQVFVASRQSYKLSESLGYQQVAGRMALFTITEDLRRAGYWGGNADVTTFVGGTVTPITPDATNFSACATSTTDWAVMLTQRVFGLDDSAAAYACIPNSGDGSYWMGDVVATRFADPETVQPAAMDASRLYVRASLFDGRVFAGTDEASNVVAPKGPVKSYPLQAKAYYVGNSGKTCDSQKIPALYRVALNGNGMPEAQELLPGVEDLQIQFGMDSDGDGTPNQYLNANEIGATQWNWPGRPQANTIVSARVWVLARAECPDPTYDNDVTYSYADRTGAAAYQPGDHFRRQLYSATVALRN